MSMILEAWVTLEFIHRASVKPLVDGEGLKVTKLIQIHTHSTPFLAKEHQTGWGRPGW